MSAYEVCPEHIQYLVELGRELEINSVVVDAQLLPLDLTNPSDRHLIGSALTTANRQATASRGLSDSACFVDRPQRSSTSNLRTLTEVVQALHWVRSYCYQTTPASRGWSQSAARRYTNQLRDSLEVRIIGFFETCWDYPPPG